MTVFLTSLYQTHLYDLILDRPSDFKFGSIFVREVSVAKVTRGREGRGAKVSHYRYIYIFDVQRSNGYRLAMNAFQRGMGSKRANRLKTLYYIFKAILILLFSITCFASENIA